MRSAHSLRNSHSHHINTARCKQIFHSLVEIGFARIPSRASIRFHPPVHTQTASAGVGCPQPRPPTHTRGCFPHNSQKRSIHHLPIWQMPVSGTSRTVVGPYRAATSENRLKPRSSVHGRRLGDRVISCPIRRFLRPTAANSAIHEALLSFPKTGTGRAMGTCRVLHTARHHGLVVCSVLQYVLTWKYW